MSIATKTGDDGTTALMYGRRIPKTHPRIEACGAVDELNAALGLARASAKPDFVRNHLLAIEKDLIVLMGETGVATEDLPRYVKDSEARRARSRARGAKNKLQGLGDARSDDECRQAGRCTNGLPPGGTARVRIEGIGRIAKRGNCGLSQPTWRFAVAVRALGGGAVRFRQMRIRSGMFGPAIFAFFCNGVLLTPAESITTGIPTRCRDSAKAQPDATCCRTRIV